VRFKCRCGHEVNVKAGTLGAVRCQYCGRAYNLSRGRSGALNVFVVGGGGEKGPGPQPSEQWPEGLGEDLELEIPSGEPSPPAAQDVQQAPEPEPAGEWPEDFGPELELDLDEPNAPPQGGFERFDEPQAPPEWPEDPGQEIELDVTPEPAARAEPRVAEPVLQAAVPTVPPAAPEEEGPARVEFIKERRSWWYYLATAWAYPFRGTAKWALLGWAALNVFVVPFLGFLLFVGFVAGWTMLGVLILYEFELIRQSSYDAEAKPSVPQWDSFYESAIRPLGQLIAVFLGSGIPFFIAVMIVKHVGKVDASVAIERAVGGNFAWEWASVLLGGSLLSLFMVPMNMLAVATADSAFAINPKFTFPAVLKVPLSYMVCTTFCGLCFFGALVLRAVVFAALGGGFIGAFAGQTVWLYLITVAARALGTLQYAYSERMGWME
jgi:hypothetical protein